MSGDWWRVVERGGLLSAGRQRLICMKMAEFLKTSGSGTGLLRGALGYNRTANFKFN
jgi:hypothetical protein